MDTHAALYAQGQQRLAYLRAIAPRQSVSLEQKMADNGITRRDFIKWSAAMTAMLALPLPFSNLVAEAAELADRVLFLAEGEIVADGSTLDVLLSSPAFAPQVAKVMSPKPWLTVSDVVQALAQ